MTKYSITALTIESARLSIAEDPVIDIDDPDYTGDVPTETKVNEPPKTELEILGMQLEPYVFEASCLDFGERAGREKVSLSH